MTVISDPALRVLIVCTANRFRSPLAERIVQSDWCDCAVDVSSAGLLAHDGAIAHHTAVALASRHGLGSLESHRARLLGPALLRRADLVLTMEERQQTEVQRLLPMFTGRVMTLGSWRGVEIDDPIVSSEISCEWVFELMRACLEDWRRQLESSGLLPRRLSPMFADTKEPRHV